MQKPVSPFRPGRACLVLPLCAGLAVLSACNKSAPAAAPATAAAKDGSIALNAQQIDRLGVKLASAQPAAALPIGTVPGVVSLPPDARVAVTTPYAGTVVKVLVIQGQVVRQGEVLAIVRAAESVQFGAALARSQAELPVVAANAARLEQLSREGIIAPARADEARAALASARATVAENRRLLALGGAARDGTITLRAPISGRVASVAVDTGGAVGNGIAPFIVENSANLRLDLQVPERLAGQVRPGMDITVTQDGRMARGTVLSISGSLDPLTRSLAAKASLPSDSSFVPGKGVMVTIAGPAAVGGVSLPASAVTHVGDHDEVFVRTATGFRATRVTVAGQIGDLVFLSAGVRPGSQIATSSVAELKSLSQGQ
ncbi:efflux RND transporter periplasmic adaptor subunit [Novosphingobium sp.]|uniref:efflux RND transporter periplasmic adaptor subunit n=1 Tax=Novosphingobium sp. TaxID=1874826 RepID=UPI0033414A20